MRETRMTKALFAVADLGEDYDEHVAFVIAARQPRADKLGLNG